MSTILTDEMGSLQVKEEISIGRKMQMDSYIDLSKKLPPPPLVLSIGTHDFKGVQTPTRFATKGNFSCISGGSKSKKTVFKSMLGAAYIGGNAGMYSPFIKGHRGEADNIFLDIDTEQSEYDSQFVFQRVSNLVGNQWDYYKPHSLRKYDYKERVQFVEYMIYEGEYKDNIGLISIDGIADLILDPNSVFEANNIVQKLMKWTADKHIHIINILHNNPGSDKTKGHLGTYIDQKAETRCVVKSDERGIATVSFPFARGYPVDEFRFKINSDWLPTTHIEDFNPDRNIQPIGANTKFDDEPF